VSKPSRVLFLFRLQPLICFKGLKAGSSLSLPANGVTVRRDIITFLDNRRHCGSNPRYARAATSHDTTHETTLSPSSVDGQYCAEHKVTLYFGLL